MTLEEAEVLMNRYPDATVQEIAGIFSKINQKRQLSDKEIQLQQTEKIQRSRALFQADSELEVDQILCDVMFVLQKVSALTSISKAHAMKRRSEDAAKALVIARHALEIAAEGLTKEYRPFMIKRVP